MRHSPEIAGLIVFVIYWLLLEQVRSDWTAIFFTWVVPVGFLTFIFVIPNQTAVRGDVVLAALVGLGVGLVARKLWQMGSIGRLILASLLIANSCGFLYYVFLNLD
jgi:hypothetical protein